MFFDCCPQWMRRIVAIDDNIKIIDQNNLSVTLAVRNFTGQDTRRYIGDDTRNLTAYFVINPIWNAGVRYKL